MLFAPSIAEITWSWLDGWIIVVAVLCAVSAALLGNFLVLRKMSLMADAISHAVLPGLAVAFFVTESRASLPMFLGAAAVGVLTALLTELVRSLGKVDEGASMGVVFTALFALGLVMVVQAADHVDLDPGCVLYGAIETTPLDRVAIGGFSVPRAAIPLSLTLAVNALFVMLFYKELKLSSFDPDLATSVGVNARAMHYALMTLVAVTAVACFESVGNILVVAMFIVPPAAAYLLTDRLPVMIVLTVVIAVLSAVLGHVAAVVVPSWFGYGSTYTAGMITVAAGAIFGIVVLVAPRYGVISKIVHQLRLAVQIAREDFLGLLYRAEETHEGLLSGAALMERSLASGRMVKRLALWRLVGAGRIENAADGYRLTDLGRREARELLRSHRLWESYLDRHLDIPPERVHGTAERIEHFTGPGLQSALATDLREPEVDPHGKAIPPQQEPKG
jgi:manganese/zinc/iron transport system permease protein